MNAKDWVNATAEAEQTSEETAGGVADDGDGLHDRPGSELAERDGVEELGAAHHPVVALDYVGLHRPASGG
jgi:hypothetical protein